MQRDRGSPLPGVASAPCATVGKDAPVRQGWLLLEDALLKHEMGSSTQACAWSKALAQLPAPLQTTLPTLRHLLELADKAWPRQAD